MQLRHPHPYLEPHRFEKFIPFAHRGGSTSLPENSLSAFKAAADLGFRYLETDVQITSDGHLVAFHDNNLFRTCGVDAEISSMTRGELSQVRIGGIEEIPLLADLFEELPDAFFNIDAKSDECVDPLINFLRGSGSLARVCVGSFSHRRLERVRAACGEEVCTSASPKEVAVWMIGVTPSGPSCLQIPIEQSSLRIATRKRVSRARDQGLPVHIWTVDDPRTMQELIDDGVDGIMTDEATVLKRVAEQNLLWH